MLELPEPPPDTPMVCLVWMCDRLLLVANSSSHVAITTVLIPYNHSINTPITIQVVVLVSMLSEVAC